MSLFCQVPSLACARMRVYMQKSEETNLYLQGKITAQGKLLLHGPLMVAELSSMPSRGREWQVFLFEQNIIFSEAVGKKTQFTNPAYIYKAHIQVRTVNLDSRYLLLFNHCFLFLFHFYIFIRFAIT